MKERSLVEYFNFNGRLYSIIKDFKEADFQNMEWIILAHECYCSGELLWIRWTFFGSQKREIDWLAKPLFASQEGVCYFEIVITF